MTLTVTHQFVSGVADDPTAAAAGEVLPSHWNAQHVVTGVALEVATSNLTLFVNGGTGSDSNDGSSAHPFATIQHAISIGLSKDYQSLYTLTIQLVAATYAEHPKIAGGIFQGVATAQNSANAFLIGDPLNPANVKIQPNDASGDDILKIIGGFWAFDGIRFVADPTETAGGNFINALNVQNLLLGTIDFDTGTGRHYSGLLNVQQASRCSFYGATPGTGSFNYYGDGATLDDCLNAARYTLINLPIQYVFNTVMTGNGGSAFFSAFVNATYNINGATFVTPSNIAVMVPFNMVQESGLIWGADPALTSWPGGAFSTSRIDNSCNVDGYFFGTRFSGAPVDESTIYRGSWQIHKDSNQTTGAGLSLTVDDGGIIQVKQIGRVPNTQTGTPYVLALSDQDGRVEMSNAGANQLTVPANATVAFPIGTEIRIVQVGAGATTIAGAVGVTVDAAGVVGGQWKSVMLYKRGTNEWVQTNV